MQGENHPAKLALKRRREQVLELLSAAFVKDELGLDDFEQRVDRAYRAASEVELVALVSDLVATPATGTNAVVDATFEPAVGDSLAGSSVEAAIVAPRDARAAPRNALAVSTLPRKRGALAVLGNVELTVPPNLAVDCEGSGFLGSVSSVNRVPPDGTEGGPLLRIVGSAVFGNVEIHTLPRGADFTVGSRLLAPGKAR